MSSSLLSRLGVVGSSSSLLRRRQQQRAVRCSTITNRMTRRCKSTRPAAADSSVLDTATDFLATLRLQAASALTASLPVDERRTMLEQFAPPPSPATTKKEESDASSKKASDDDTTMLRNSIAEAVAEARAHEAKQQKAKWEREKSQILEDAQQAAAARVASELAMQQHRHDAYQRWQHDLQHAKQQQEEKERDGKSTSATAAVTAATTATTPHGEATATTEAVATHPILGPVVLDLGQKQIYQVSSTQLANIPVWKKQRIYRHDRAKLMAADKMKSLHLGVLGTIALHEVCCDVVRPLIRIHGVSDPFRCDVTHLLVCIFILCYSAILGYGW